MNKNYLWIRGIVYMVVILLAGAVTVFAQSVAAEEMSLDEILAKSQDDSLEWSQLSNESEAESATAVEFGYDISEVPETIDEFVEMRDRVAVTPWGGAAMFVMAMMVYADDPETGMDCFTAMLVNDSTLLRNVTPWGYKGLEPQSYIKDRVTLIQAYPYIARSYLQGAVPENGYTVSDYKCTFVTNTDSKVSVNEFKLWILSSGDEEPREITLELNSKGIWKMWSWDVMISHVETPVLARFDEL